MLQRPEPAAAGSIEQIVPELPEVETVANGVHARVAGSLITAVWTSGKPQTFKTPEDVLVATLTGARLERVRRVGKTVVGDLLRPDGTRAQWLVHLGMTGRLLVSAPEVPLAPHTHAVVTLADGREVRFVDPRRFGRLSVLPVTGSHASSAQASDAPRTDPNIAAETQERGATETTLTGYQGPGAEPTTITAAEFANLFRGRRLAIKAALLNQALLHGVGNIYADESLFRAGIRPRKAAGRLTGPELRRLHAALQSVLAKAIELGGSSVSDYVDADGVRGFFQLEHRVYGRAGQPCRDCSRELRKVVVGGRTTVYCPQCQH